jgi:hypothetical protein
LDADRKFNELLVAERAAYEAKAARLLDEAQLRADAIEALNDVQLAPSEARLLEEEALQAQLAPLQEEARAIMARGGTVDVPAALRAGGGRATERLDYAVAPLTPEQLGKADAGRLAEAATPPGGGFTIDVRTGNQPTEGFSVAISGHETPVPADHNLTQAIETFKAEHADELAQPGTHLGGWHDDIEDSPTFGQVVLDISHVEPTQEAAEAFGRAHGQTAIYDLKKGETLDIRTAESGGAADAARLAELSEEKDRILAAHEQRILDAPITDPAESKAVTELDSLIDSKVVEQVDETGETVYEEFKQGLTPKQVDRAQLRFERAKTAGTAEQLEPDIWKWAEPSAEPITHYVKLGADGRIVSERVVSKDGKVIAESVRGLEHIDEVAPGRALGRAHWKDQGIDTLEKARAEIAKQNFSADGARLNKLLVRDLVRGLPTTAAPTAEQIVEALDNGTLRALRDKTTGKVSILTKAGVLRQGGRKVSTLEAIRTGFADVTGALDELDQLAAGGEAAFNSARNTRAGRALAANEAKLGVVARDARRVGTKVEKQAFARGKRVGKASVALHRSYSEMNKAMTQLQGIGADFKPAMSFTSDVGGHTGMVPLRVKGLEGAWAHAYIAEEMHYMLEGKTMGTLQNAWRDHILGPWKRWATYRNPGFHVRNFFGAWFNNFLGGVNKADYEFATRVLQPKYADVILPDEDFLRLGLHLTPGFGEVKGKLTYGDVADMLSEQGMGRANTTAVAYADEAGKELINTKRGKVAKLLKTYDKYAREAGSLTEDFHRTAAWAGGMRTTQGDLHGARGFVMARHGDYDDLTSVEQNLKDIIPFYKWMRTNTPYQIRMLAENPGKLSAMLKLQRSIADAEGLDWEKYNASKPEWVKQTFSIPLPGGGSLVQDLPYSDLFMGFKEFLSRALPVGGNFIESYGFGKELFTGRELTGKMVPFSGPLGEVANLPGFKQVLQALPWVQAGADGKLYLPDTMENVMQVFPLYARFRPFVTGDPERAPSRLTTTMSWLTGARVVPPDLTAQEQSFYYDMVEPALEQYTSLGYTFPTKDELTAAGALTQAPEPFDFTSAYPEGLVA